MQRNISIIYSSENRFFNFKQIGDMVIIPIYSLLYSVLVAVNDSVHTIMKRICCLIKWNAMKVYTYLGNYF